MLRPCPEVAPFCPDDPLGNYSSEADDSLDFISTQYAGNPPPLLKDWTAISCGKTFISRVSQIDADMQAAAAAELCLINGECPGCQIFFNSPQTCCVPCPNGSSSCFTVPGGIFPGLNQEQANQQAELYACFLANARRMCLGDLPTTLQCAAKVSQQLLITGGTPPIAFSVIAGALPNGLALSGSGLLSGTPSLGGSYSFIVRAASANGFSAQKTYNISVSECVGVFCPDLLANSVDSATLTSWTTPAKFAFRYPMHLVLGQMNTFQVRVPITVPNAGDLVRLYTSGGVLANSAQAQSLSVTTFLTDQYRALQVFIYGIATGDYLLEISVPVSGTTLTRESNDFPSQSITTTVASPRTHDGLNNFAAVFDFNWKAGDCFALWSAHVGSAPYAKVYDSAFNLVTITANSNFASLTDNHFIVVPSDGLYHVEVALTGAATGQLLLATCCAVISDFTLPAVPANQLTPYVPGTVLTVSGHPTSCEWYLSQSVTFHRIYSSSIVAPCPAVPVSTIIPPASSYRPTVNLVLWRAGIFSNPTHTMQNSVFAFIPSFTVSPTTLNNSADISLTNTTAKDPAVTLTTWNWTAKRIINSTTAFFSGTFTGSAPTFTAWVSVLALNPATVDQFLFNVSIIDSAGRIGATAFTIAQCQLTNHVVYPGTHMSVATIDPAINGPGGSSAHFIAPLTCPNPATSPQVFNDIPQLSHWDIFPYNVDGSFGFTMQPCAANLNQGFDLTGGMTFGGISRIDYASLVPITTTFAGTATLSSVANWTTVGGSIGTPPATLAIAVIP